METKLFIVDLMRFNLDSCRPLKEYYAYETNTSGVIIQKHGFNSEGTPFKSKQAAKQWVELRTLLRG